MPNRAFLLFALIASPGWISAARAQAGPPLITNDTGTPGPGKWEINLAATATHSDAAWNWSAPDADINYGVGDRIQLSVHAAWQHSSANGRTFSSIGAIEYAMRWRFVDQAASGFDLAVQPHVVLPGSKAAIAHGLSPANREFALPIQAVRHGSRLTVGAELTRHWVEHERGAAQAGVFLARDCGPLECLAELNSTHEFGNRTETFAGVGTRWALSDQIKLMAAFEHQINGPSRQRADIVYLGFQLTP